MTDTRGKRAVRAAVEMAEPAAAQAGSAGGAPGYLADRFEMLPDGLRRKSEGEKPSWVCGWFEIIAETRDDEGKNWGFLLSWRDRDGMKHEESFPRTLFVGECNDLRQRLADAGLTFNGAAHARAAFAEYLNVASSGVRARSVSRPGWHQVGSCDVFVLPDIVFGDSGERVVLQTGEREPSLFRVAGTVATWKKEVSRLCVGNSRLLFATSCAFAAPLLTPLGLDGGGFNLLGKSSLGKSTALRVACSVCGGTAKDGAYGFRRSWRATSNGLEAIASAHNDVLLPLDEMGQADGREVGDTAYMLSNGEGRNRAGRTGLARATARWRTLFLSTGEVGIKQKLTEAGKTAKAGMEVRLADIPADAGAGLGLFENLHGDASGGAFAATLTLATSFSYGAPLRAFLAHVTAELAGDAMGYPAELRAWHQRITASYVRPLRKADGQVHRVAERFALIGLAGELAAQAEIADWPVDAAVSAAGACFTAWLSLRGTAGALEDAQAVAQLRSFLSKHGQARFEPWVETAKNDAVQGDPDESAPPAERFKTLNRAGFRRWVMLDTGRSGWRFYLSAAGKDEALEGLAPRDAMKTLVAAGLIVPSAAASDLARGTVPGLMGLPAHGKMRLYRVADDVMADTEDDD